MSENTTCPKCKRTSHHPMDVFFKWCPACRHNYSDESYRDQDRAELGQIKTDEPDWTLKQVMADFRRFR